MAGILEEKVFVEKVKSIMFDFKVKLSVNARFLYVYFLVTEEKPITHTELSEVTNIKSPVTLRKVIHELERNGLIEVTRLSKGQVYKVL
ncbi:Rrf2 family transcriptional regulator [Bacillus cereus group sp. BfR-BA-01319]|uniref:Rrf2 family transcriptional regulator n=3 Tax=Xenorhabdus TaxID=626 RepID=A0AAW3YSH1_9GAMM|nr:Rrf2 family transcriptional regulator [Bacillus cereus group sp. BfR-BA-01319]MBD2800457.1 Rrf2 family transcriptional regulator [Xenorhabdus sp. M]MDA2526364.1 Rrf2 family transcriptional regulator [Bacillus cereus]